jgi:hypothetical protein
MLISQVGIKDYCSVETERHCNVRIEGRSWVVLGDPVGPQEEWAELIWRFREMRPLRRMERLFEVGRHQLHSISISA